LVFTTGKQAANLEKAGVFEGGESVGDF